MKTMTVRAEVSTERVLKLEVPCDMPPGPVDVVLVANPRQSDPAESRLDWSGPHGLGREVWRGVDALDYVRDLRTDREATAG